MAPASFTHTRTRDRGTAAPLVPSQAIGALPKERESQAFFPGTTTPRQTRELARSVKILWKNPRTFALWPRFGALCVSGTLLACCTGSPAPVGAVLFRKNGA
jgi:hypothetical protein